MTLHVDPPVFVAESSSSDRRTRVNVEVNDRVYVYVAVDLNDRVEVDVEVDEPGIRAGRRRVILAT